MRFMKTGVATALVVAAGQTWAVEPDMTVLAVAQAEVPVVQQPAPGASTTIRGAMASNQTKATAPSQSVAPSAEQRQTAEATPKTQSELQQQKAAAQEQLEKMKEQTMAETETRKSFFRWFKKAAA